MKTKAVLQNALDGFYNFQARGFLIACLPGSENQKPHGNPFLRSLAVFVE
jgi:hypothetical protein